MKKINKFLLLLLVCSPYANAAFGDMQKNTPSIHKGAIDHLFPRGTSSSTSSSNGTGSSITTTGKPIVSGVPVPVTVQSDYTKGAITAGAIAAAALCGSNPIVTIVCAAAIEYGLTKGIKVCEESGWCKSDPEYVPFDGYEYAASIVSPVNYLKSVNAACDQGLAVRATIWTGDYSVEKGSPYIQKNSSGVPTGCGVNRLYKGAPSGTQNFSVNRRLAQSSCTDPSCTIPPSVPSAPPHLDPGFPPYLDGKQGGDPSFGPKIAGESTGAGHPPVSSPAGGPTVSAPPVTGAPKVTTSDTTKPDGSTDTTTTSETTTVTPTITNNNTSNPEITYNTTTNTTTSVTNNVTNITNTTHSTTSLPNEQPVMELPKDYNKEETQQQIKELLEAPTAPTMPDQKAIVDSAKTKSDTDLAQLQTDAKTGQADKTAWFSWVWTPPVGTCQAFTGNVHGYAISWDMCPTVNNIRDVLAWLFALFGALEIYGQLFKRND